MDPRIMEYLGLDPALAVMIPLWMTVVKKALYPAMRMRRRNEDDKDQATGLFYVPARLQWLAVSTTTCIVSGSCAIAAGKPIIDWISAGILSVGLAMGWHTSRKR